MSTLYTLAQILPSYMLKSWMQFLSQNVTSHQFSDDISLSPDRFLSQSRHNMWFYLLQRSNLSAKTWFLPHPLQKHKLFVDLLSCFVHFTMLAIFMHDFIVRTQLIMQKNFFCKSMLHLQFWETIYILMPQVKFQSNKCLNSQSSNKNISFSSSPANVPFVIYFRI